MAQVSLPYTLTAGTPENVNNLVANLNALVAGVNTIDTAQLASGAVTPAKLSAAVPKGLLGSTTYAQTGLNYNAFAGFGSVIDCGTVAANRKLLITFTGSLATLGSAATASFGLQFVAGGSTSNVDDISGVAMDANSRVPVVFHYLYTTTAGTLTVQLRSKKFDNVTCETSATNGMTYHLLSVVDVGGS